MGTETGATRPAMGTETWTQWRFVLEEKGRANEIKHEAADRSFRFGTGDIKKSRHAVSFPIDLEGNEITVKVYLVDGSVPFLVARPLLEEWGIVCDFRNRKFMILANGQWCPMHFAERQGPRDLQPPGRLDVQNPHRGRRVYCPRQPGSRNSAVGIRRPDRPCRPYRDDTHYPSGLGQLLY